jgi:hypothetical protein
MNSKDLADSILKLVSDEISSVDPKIAEDMTITLTEVAALAARYAQAAASGDPTAQKIERDLSDTAMVVEARIAGMGQETLGVIVNSVITILAKFAAGMLVAAV